MRAFIHPITALILLLNTDPCWAIYTKYTKNQHIIHIVQIPAHQYRAQLVKAHDGDLQGRESLSSIANRTKADLAINGGFFQIGTDQDGDATGSLVIKNKIYKLKNITQALAIIHNEKLTIQQTNPKTFLKDKPHQLFSLVSGIPLLINNGIIVSSLKNKTSDFYTHMHARTAIGIKNDGTIIIIVAEHFFDMGRGHYLALLKKILAFSSYAKGLTILELAHLMKTLGCQYALNLDGGGSSTLWMKGKIINQTTGDQDEHNAIGSTRPISDALVFHLKS